MHTRITHTHTHRCFSRLLLSFSLSDETAIGDLVNHPSCTWHGMVVRAIMMAIRVVMMMIITFAVVMIMMVEVVVPAIIVMAATMTCPANYAVHAGAFPSTLEATTHNILAPEAHLDDGVFSAHLHLPLLSPLFH